jgi:hypothetical protein
VPRSSRQRLISAERKVTEHQCQQVYKALKKAQLTGVSSDWQNYVSLKNALPHHLRPRY